MIDFALEFGIPQWGGFRYWMAMTPYPNGDDSYENPSLLVSQDGFQWSAPPGLPWPIDIKPGTKHSNPAHYNSDPELVYVVEENCLVLYWRETLVGVVDQIWNLRIQETLPYSLGRKTLCLSVPFTSEGLLLSPTIWRKNPTEWSMWTCNGQEIEHRTSQNGIHWEDPRRCKLMFRYDQLSGLNPWHLCAKPNYFSNHVEFLICGSYESSQKPMFLWYAEASFDNVLELLSPFQDFVMKPSENPLRWDNEMIYRSSFTRVDSRIYPYYRVWYSARSKKGTWHIGHREGVINVAPNGQIGSGLEARQV